LRSPWAHRRKVDIAELVHERWTLTSDQVIHEFVLEAFRARGLPPPREQVTASSMLLRSRLLDTGRYLTVLPTSVLAHNARAWGIKALPVELDMQPMCLTLVTLRRRTLSPVAILLMDQVRALCRPAAGV
jgi:DNA-binding transcriptional LysR family regulator